jgi:hypothetical protein
MRKGRNDHLVRVDVISEIAKVFEMLLRAKVYCSLLTVPSAGQLPAYATYSCDEVSLSLGGDFMRLEVSLDSKPPP